MASAALSRVSSRPSVLSALRQAMNIRFEPIKGNRHSGFRRFSIFKEEAKSDPEFQKSVKNLNENIGMVKEDLGARAHKTMEKYEKAEDVSTQAKTIFKKLAEDTQECCEASDNPAVHEIHDPANSSWRSDEEVRQLHKEWMAEHNRSYSSPSEEESRFKIFKKTLRQIEMHNAAADRGEHSYWQGLNQFSDLMVKEIPMGRRPLHRGLPGAILVSMRFQH